MSRSRLVGAAILAFLLFLCVAPARAQQPAGATISGTVTDALGGKPAPGVEVRVRAVGDTAVIADGLTDASGRYSIGGVPAGTFEVLFRRLGYSLATDTVTVAAGASQTIAMSAITLMPAAVQIMGIQVVAEQPDVVHTADRDIYAASALPGMAGGSATDVLQNVPDLEVDINGEVTMYGEQPAIYINGREAPMQGESLALFLEQFAADNIERIEVIPNPSARYHAEGSGGIVNIVLKKDVGLGISGNAYVNGGTRGQYGGGGRATYQRGPLTLNGGGSLRLSRDESTSSQLRQNLLADPITWLGQDGSSDRSSWGGNLDLGADYEMTESTTLEAEARVRRNSSDSDRATRYTEMDADKSVTDVYDLISSADGSGRSANLDLELRHELASADSDSDEGGRNDWERDDEVSVEVEFDRDIDGDRKRVERRLLEDLGLVDYASELTWEDDHETDSEFSVSADFLRGFGKSTELELGYEGEFGWTDRSRMIETQTPDAPGEGIAEDHGFVHRQTIHSGYATVNRSFGEFSAQVGARAEHAGNWLELPNEGGVFGRNYFSVFPSANMNYSFGGGKRVRLSYSMRIRRPSSSVLNPINTSSDPLNLEVGNPDIEPQYTHSYTLNASWSGDLGYLRATPFYRRSVNEWEELRTVDANGVSTTTYENLGSTNSYGVSFTASLRNFRGTDARVSLNGQRTDRNYAAVLDRATPSSTRWSIRTNLEREFGSSFSAEGSLVYNPARELPQGRRSATTMTRLGMRYRILDRKAALRISLTDPFDIYDSSVVRSSKSYVESGQQRVSMRRLSLSLSYSFQGAGGGGRGRGGRR
jgi:outer membrane receptor protein involved in Fe transport